MCRYSVLLNPLSLYCSVSVSVIFCKSIKKSVNSDTSRLISSRPVIEVDQSAVAGIKLGFPNKTLAVFGTSVSADGSAEGDAIQLGVYACNSLDHGIVKVSRPEGIVVQSITQVPS